MKRRNLYRIAIVVILSIICSNAFAQKEENTPGEVWKKKVGRVIDMSQKEDTASHHLTDAKQDTSIFEMIVNAIKAGKLAAYEAYDADFTIKLSSERLKEMIYGKVDTIMLIDPITNSEMEKIVRKDFDFNSIHKYRILEEWALNPHTGKTDIQITGIAPIRDIYSDDGVFRGVQAMFWVRFNDLHSILAKYEQYHPDNTIGMHVWNDYFLSDVKPEGVK